MNNTTCRGASRPRNSLRASLVAPSITTASDATRAAPGGLGRVMMQPPQQPPAGHFVLEVVDALPCGLHARAVAQPQQMPVLNWMSRQKPTVLPQTKRHRAPPGMFGKAPGSQRHETVRRSSHSIAERFMQRDIYPLARQEILELDQIAPSGATSTGSVSNRVCLGAGIGDLTGYLETAFVASGKELAVIRRICHKAPRVRANHVQRFHFSIAGGAADRPRPPDGS